MPMLKALMRPRSVLPRRYTIPILRILVRSFLLTTVIIDVFVFFPVIVGLLLRQFGDGWTDTDAVAEGLSQFHYSAGFLMAVAAVNVVLLTGARLMFLRMRRIRAHPHMYEPDSHSASS